MSRRLYSLHSPLPGQLIINAEMADSRLSVSLKYGASASGKTKIGVNMVRRVAAQQHLTGTIFQPSISSQTPATGAAALFYIVMGTLSAACVFVICFIFVSRDERSLEGFTGFAIIKIAMLVAIGVIALLQSVRLRTRAIGYRRSLAEARAINERILSVMNEAVVVTDVRRQGAGVVYANPAFEQVTGYSVNEAIGRDCRYLQGSDRLQPELAEIRAAIENRAAICVTLRNYRKDGCQFWNELKLAPVFSEDGSATHFVGIIRDITELREAASRLEAAGHIDRLTLVASRSFFYDNLANLLGAPSTSSVVLAKIDVARFHEINMSYGYEVGDLLLKQIAARLTRSADSIIGRLSADEFAVAMIVAGTDDVNRVVSKLLEVLRPKFALPAGTIEVRFAIGFALGAHGADPKMLMRQAGAALQESRRSPLREVRRFDPATDEKIKSRVRLTNDLHQALTNEEFVLYYQPKVELASGKIIGAEALIRWRHPMLGVLPPGQFIPIAEEIGLILDIGAWVLRKAAQFSVWLNRDRSVPLTVSVNVSQLQFTNRNIREFVEEVIRGTGANPSWLILELTESLFADGSPEMVETFKKLRDMGLGLSIDDFGTGYSSLRYLERFPISEIKLDKSFVQDLSLSRVKQVIVEAVMRLAVELDISVIAEGIETEAERATLREFHCVYGQGYLFSRPVSVDKFLGLCRKQSAGS
jgi:PAS domain S-box-containing protein/diguanylate cyclase (GGDEF)-like protein